MSLRRFGPSVVNVYTYLDLFQTIVPAEVSPKILKFCRETAEIVGKAATAGAGTIELWICLDRIHPAAVSQSSRFFKSNVDIRIDISRSSEDHERHYVGLSASFLNPDSFDFLKGGRPSYRQWLLKEFAMDLSLVLRSAGPSESIRRAALDSSHIWIYGETDKVFHVSLEGELGLAGNQVIEPEAAFESPQFVIPGVFDNGQSRCQFT